MGSTVKFPRAPMHPRACGTAAWNGPGPCGMLSCGAGGDSHGRVGVVGLVEAVLWFAAMQVVVTLAVPHWLPLLM